MMTKTLLLTAFATALLAQNAPVLFDDIKLFYQRPGETKFRDDKGLLVLDGTQKVTLLLRENRPLLILRYENIQSLSFDEKKDKTLTINYGAAGGPSGMVRMELGGRWKVVLDTLKAQAGKPVEMVVRK